MWFTVHSRYSRFSVSKIILKNYRDNLFNTIGGLWSSSKFLNSVPDFLLFDEFYNIKLFIFTVYLEIRSFETFQHTSTIIIECIHDWYFPKYEEIGGVDISYLRCWSIIDLINDVMNDRTKLTQWAIIFYSARKGQYYCATLFF